MTMHGETFRILAVLTRGGEGESGEILDRIHRLDPDGAPSLATFYRRLKQGVDEGWIDVAEGGATGPGRPPRLYRITPCGRDAVRAEATRRARFSDLVLPAGEEGG